MPWSLNALFKVHRWYDYSRVFCTTHKIISLLVFWFFTLYLQRKKVFNHLEYMNQEGEEKLLITQSNVYVSGMSFFSENRIEVRGIRKEQEATGKVRKWKVVETVGADRGFFDGSLSTASISLWLNQVVQICGLINCFKCQTIQAIAQDPNPKRGLKITQM